MRRQTVLQGSIWLMASAILAKILGAVFRIPLTALLGGDGMGYFSSAYGLFLPVFTLSVTGINTAVAALTAEALARGNQQEAAAVNQAAKRMFGFAGLLLSAGLFFFAKPLCAGLLQNPPAALAVQAFAPAVWFCCMNAVLRGRFEGMQQMRPTAISQTAEGIGRVCCGLLAVVWTMKHWTWLQGILPAGTSLSAAAAAAAILGVTLSTAIGLVTLWLFSAAQPRVRGDVPACKGMALALLRMLLPVAAAALVTNLTTLIDLAAGLRVLAASMLRHPADYGYNTMDMQAAQSLANFYYGAFSGLAMTVFNLVPSITNMLGKCVFPAFADAYVRREQDALREHSRLVLQRTGFLAIPAGMGITFLSEPILQLLFASRPVEIALVIAPLRWLGLAVICAALGYPIFSMLQAAGQPDEPVKVMLAGAAVKLMGNLYLIPRMQLQGAALATLLCYGVILFLAVMRFQRRMGFRLQLRGYFCGILLASLLCAGTAYSLHHLLTNGGIGNLYALPLSILAGGIVYLGCCYGAKKCTATRLDSGT